MSLVPIMSNEAVISDLSSNSVLTQKQKDTLDWIESFLLTNGYSPTIREMVEGLGLGSPAPVQSRLYQLKEKGFISWVPGRARTITRVHRSE